MSDEKESLLLVVACEKRKNVLEQDFSFLGGGRKGVNRIQISNGVFGKAVAKTKLTKQF